MSSAPPADTDSKSTHKDQHIAQTTNPSQHGSGSSSGLRPSAASFTPPAAPPAAASPAPATGTATSLGGGHGGGSGVSGSGSSGAGGGGGGRGGKGRGGLSREFQRQPRTATAGGGNTGLAAAGGGRQQHGRSGGGSGGGGSGRGGRQAAQEGAGAHDGSGGSAGAGIAGSSPGRKGFLTANHLLGFQSRRESERSHGGGGSGSGGGARGGRGGGGRGGPPRRPAPKPQPYDRNKFLQANFRFLVSDALDVKRFQSDPDRMLEWEDVVQVEMLSSQPVRCPITLEDRPFCPQITPCGHVFSFPAIIGHLVNHGGPELRKSAPCPLCYTQIAARELRLVRVHQVAAPAVGQPATFQLLRRPRDSILPEVVAAGTAGASSPRQAQHAAAAGSPSKAKGRQPGSGGSGSGGGSTAASAAAAEAKRGGAWVGPTGDVPGSAGTAGTAGGVTAAGAGAGAGADGGTSQVPFNPFAKFSLVGAEAASALWVAEARRLGQYAAQVTAEGGLEAAYEAPNLYSAIDALAARARAAAERRQRVLLEAADPLSQDALLSPEDAGQQAAQAVKGATTAALSAATVRREQAAAQAAREAAFPSLAAAAGAGAPPAGGATSVSRGGPAQAQAGSAHTATLAPGVRSRQGMAGSTGAYPAFSDDDEVAAGPASSAPAASSAPPGRARQPRTAAVPIAAASGGGGSSRGLGASPSPAELSSSARSAGGLLGSSPADASAAAGLAGSGAGGGVSPDQDHTYFYQASDGSWLFLCPLNLRMLLSHYGWYAACPPTITAKVLEVEDVVQDEVSRRRMRVLAHLPLTATFKLCEIDLSSLLPAEALVPFADELAQREKKRAQRAKQEARRLKQERAAAAAAAAAAANSGLTAAELRAMPLPSATLLPAALDREAAEDAAATAAAAAAAAGAAEGAGGEEEEELEPPPPPQPGVSFAAIARDGFAATGPALGGPTPQASAAASAAGPGSGPAPASAPAPAPRGVWGAKPGTGTGGGVASAAAAGTTSAWGAATGGGLEATAAAQQLAGLQVAGSGGGSSKGGKGKKLLLFGGPQRKY